MKTTTREFVTTTKDGKEVKIVATFVSELTISPYLHNYPNPPRNYISTYGSSMVVYVDGVRIKQCNDPAFWRLIDVDCGKKIWGLPIAFADADKIAAYTAFLADLMQEDDEVLAFRAEQTRKEVVEELKRCKQIVARCEKGWMVESAAEAKAKRDQWNNLHNEGGEGYIPTWYPRELYEYALAYIKQHGDE